MTLASQIAALATTIANTIRDTIKPRLAPPGGAANSVLAKTTGNDYAYGWTPILSLTSVFTQNLYVQKSGDALAVVESLAAPTTSYRSKQIYSSANVGGGNDWLFRHQRPSDGATEDFLLKQGSGGTIWTSGNFTPANYLALAGGGTVTAQSVFTQDPGGTIASRAGDGSGLQVRTNNGGAAAMTFHRAGYFAGWFGLDQDNEWRFGGWSWGNGNSWKFWHEKNFDPTTKVNKSGDTLAGIFNFRNSDAQITLLPIQANAPGWRLNGYADGNFYLQVADANGVFGSNAFYFSRDGSLNTAQFGDLNSRIEARAGAYASASQAAAQGYADGVGATRLPLSGGTMSGSLYIKTTVPELQLTSTGSNGTTWKLQSSPNGSFYLYTNGNAPEFNFFTGGAISTAQFGDLNNRIEARAAAYANNAQAASVQKIGDTMTGTLNIVCSYPGIQFIYPGNYNYFLQLREDARMYFLRGQDGAGVFSLGTDGSVNTSQLGDLNSRIENRAAAYSNNVYNSVVSNMRFVYAGDLGNDWNVEANNYAEPYGGATMTSRISHYQPQTGNYVSSGFRWRYVQFYTPNSGWVTAGYA